MSDSRVSASTTVAAPPAVVFAILADPRQHARIDGSGSVRGSVSGPERLERGAEFGMDMKMYGLPYKISNRVVEFEEAGGSRGGTSAVTGGATSSPRSTAAPR